MFSDRFRYYFIDGVMFDNDAKRGRRRKNENRESLYSDA